MSYPFSARPVLVALVLALLAPMPAVAQVGPDFPAAYRAAGRPRIVVFWNRQLSDNAASEYDVVTRGSSEHSGAAVAGRNWAGAHNSSDVTVATGVHRSQEGKRDSTLGERSDWKVETVFTSDLVHAGVALVDRDTIVRVTGRDIADLFANQQANEIKALLGHADIILEVLQTSGRGPLGTAFKVSAKDIRTGRILAQFVTEAAPPERPARWVPGPSGFVRETPSDDGSVTRWVPGPSGFVQETRPANENVPAHRLADETLRALADAFLRR